jgi:hypothetical protein
MPQQQYDGVAMDTHIYQMFTDDVRSSSVSCTPQQHLTSFTLLQTVSLDNAGHIQSACSNAGSLSSFNHNQLWTIVGEWTPAMTDCAKYLNGRGVGARYDGSISQGAPVYGSCNGMTGSGASFSQDYRNFLRMSWEAQVSDRSHAHILLLIISLTFRGRSRLTSRRAAGYSGRGRQSRRTNGRIPRASSMGGSRRTPLIASTPISAIDVSLTSDIGTALVL